MHLENAQMGYWISFELIAHFSLNLNWQAICGGLRLWCCKYLNKAWTPWASKWRTISTGTIQIITWLMRYFNRFWVNFVSCWGAMVGVILAGGLQFLVNWCPTWIGEQMAYNANKLSKIVKERDKAQNWLDYFEIKYQRNPAMRPVTKVPSYISVCLHSILFFLVITIELS